jgi:hypothetical protein
MRIFNKHYWWDLKCNLQCLFNPKQKWLTKKIPRTWCDKPELIQSLLFEILVHYVEEEDGLREIDHGDAVKAGHMSQEFVDEFIETNKQLFDAYHYIKETRPVLEKAYYSALPSVKNWKDMFVPLENGNFHMRASTPEEKDAYATARSIEDDMDARDKNTLKTIVEHYKTLWY